MVQVPRTSQLEYKGNLVQVVQILLQWQGRFRGEKMPYKATFYDGISWHHTSEFDTAEAAYENVLQIIKEGK